MASRRNRWAARAAMAVFVALFCHAAAIVGFYELGPLLHSPSPLSTMAAAPPKLGDKPEDDQPMQIETLVNQLDRPEQETPEEKQREEEKKKEEEDKNPHGQVVDIARPAIEQRPDKANYVSEYDSKVDHETRHNGRDTGGAPSAMIPPTGRPDVSEPQQAQAGATKQEPATSKPGKPGATVAMREPQRAQPRPEPGPAPTENGDLEHAGSQPQRERAPEPMQRPGENGSGQTRPLPQGREAVVPGLPGERKPNLTATPDMLEKAIGRGSGSMDYLKDVDDGDSTALNSKKWKHAPFFNRVKRAVANEWHPEVVYVRHDPSGNVYGVKDRVTVLRVHLNPDGKLAAWTVLQSSGVDFLDDEAIDAFRKAAPFPNPPKDLVESDGQIHFNFAFIFELSGRNSVKVFKYN